MNIPDILNGKYSDVLIVVSVFFVKGVDTIRENQSLVKEPTIESTAFVSIAQYKIVNLREVVEEHR